MQLKVLIHGAYLALLKNKKRSFLTMIGIIIGIAAVSTIVSIGRAYEQDTLKKLNPNNGENVSVDIQFQADDQEWMFQTSEPLFTDLDIQMVERIPGVHSAEIKQEDDNKQYSYQGYYQDIENISFEVKPQEQTKLKLLAGRNLDTVDNELGNRVIVISDDLLKKQKDQSEELGFYIEENSEPEHTNETDSNIDPINYLNHTLVMNNVSYQIIGIYNEHDQPQEEDETEAMIMPSTFSYIPKKTHEKYHASEQADNVLKVYIESDYKPSDVGEKVKNALSEHGQLESRGKYSLLDFSSFTDQISQVLSSITLFVASVAGISLFIAGIGVMNMMYISVTERTKEIGIRRAMGASQKNIRLQFVLEGVMMTSVGGVFGYLLGFVFAKIAAIFLPFPIGIDILTVIISIGVSAIIGLIFSFAPANVASKKEIIEIL